MRGFLSLCVAIALLVGAIAAAAVLVMGESTERIPAVIVRGLAAREGGQTAHDCVRPVADDLFL